MLILTRNPPKLPARQSCVEIGLPVALGRAVEAGSPVADEEDGSGGLAEEDGRPGSGARRVVGGGCARAGASVAAAALLFGSDGSGTSTGPSSSFELHATTDAVTRSTRARAKGRDT